MPWLCLGPPILTTPDSILIASRVNAALFATEMGRSRWNLLTAARQRLTYAGIEMLGAVLCRPHPPTTAVLAVPTQVPSVTCPNGGFVTDCECADASLL